MVEWRPHACFYKTYYKYLEKVIVPFQRYKKLTFNNGKS